MTDKYELKENGVTISMLDEINAVAIKNRINAIHEQIMRDMNTSMFGDREPAKPLNTRQRWLNRFRIYKSRVRDAWLVLRGKADIGDCW